MAVHLPLSAEAQAEARVLMLSAHNILSPANGNPLTVPTQDMIIGAFYLTEHVEGAKGEGRVFRRLDQVERAIEAGELSLHAEIEFRSPRTLDALEEDSDGTPKFIKTTAGRVLFNHALPEEYPWVNDKVTKREMGLIVELLAREFEKATVASSLDALKDLCFNWAMKSGVTVSVDDVKTPSTKKGILEKHEAEAEKVEKQFRRGIITDGERRQKEVEIWSLATEEVKNDMERGLKEESFNPIDMMVGSGARGNMMQVRQIAGMRGLVANPRGDMIPRPIKSNFREGLDMLEYYIATPGARKGLVDTALRTADSGYLTRRLVDVSQEVIINDDDPFAEGSKPPSAWIEDIYPEDYFVDASGNYVGTDPQPGCEKKRAYLRTRLYGRVLGEDVNLSDGTVFEKATMISEEMMEVMAADPDITRVKCLTPLTDESENGISVASYGMSMATGEYIEVGEAVGVIAAQSIGEPGTQLTMRTFHTGGIAGKDLAGGLPRVVELFEARTPKGAALLTRTSGVIRIDEDGRNRTVTVVSDDGEEDVYDKIAVEARLEVRDGQEIIAGDPIIEGPRDPKELLEIRGMRETQRYLVEQVQGVYRDQGVSIHDKHIELIVRQMTRRVLVHDAGESTFLPGESIDGRVYVEANRKLVEEGKEPAKARPQLMGITKASLATDSWLSAASFQETTRVLTEAAIESKSDNLIGLKENIIIGKLIPAGTGLTQYRDFSVETPDYKPMEFYSSDEEDDDLADWMAQQDVFQEPEDDIEPEATEEVIG